MRFNLLTLAGLASMATAQTFTNCDPTKKTCPNNPAMGSDFSTDFKAGASGVKGWKQTAGSLKYTSQGAEFTINKKGDAPTIQTESYLFFGYVEVKCKAATGQGIISSIVLESDDLDEVDWEFIGTTTTNVQMNYFGKGNTTTYDRMIEGPVSNPQQSVHTYALNWTSESLTWLIDSKPVRTLKYADAVGGKNYPQTPMNVRIGIWAGGDPDNEKGVIEWAGGKTDYTKAPFTMTVESVKVINYGPGTEYKYKDQTGSYQSIEVIGAGNKGGNAVNSQVIASAAPTGSAAASGKGGAGGLVNSAVASGGAAQSTPCSEGQSKPSSPASSGAVPSNPSYPSSPAVPSGGAPPASPSGPYKNGTTPGETPCSCGVATVTVIGTPPPSKPTTLVSSAAPVGSSSFKVPPPVTVPASSVPPYPTGGLKTETAPAPSVPVPSIGTPSIPVAVNTTGPGVPQFTGAASNNKVGAIMGLAAGAALLAF